MFAPIVLLPFLAVCSAFNVTSKPFSQWLLEETPAAETTILRFGEARDKIPQDDNVSNYGDFITNPRHPKDVLLSREVVINDLSNEDAVLELNGTFGGKVTAVWVMNFGRQRGYTKSILIGGDKVRVYVAVKADCEIRLLIDIYGFEKH